MALPWSNTASSPLTAITTATQTNDGSFQTPGSMPGGGGLRDDDVEHYITFADTGKKVALSVEQWNSKWPMNFTLANENVFVQSLSFYVERPKSLKSTTTDLVPIMNASSDATEGNLYQEPRDGTKRSVLLETRDIILNNNADLGKPMVIGIGWNVSNLAGITYSPAFSIVTRPEDVLKANETLRQSKYATSQTKITSGVVGGVGGIPSGGGGGTTNSNGTSSVPTVDAGDSTHGGGRGLSTGAVAGIAVGVGLAALLAAALGVFFFLRRRRSSNAGAAGAALDQTRAAEQEKLSGFPKDGGSSSGGGGSGGHGGDIGGPNASDAAIAPYRDDDNTPTANTSHDRRRSSAAAREDVAGAGAGAASLSSLRERSSSSDGQQHGLSRHLVEEGMTAEEIRRLEEEEAHLDHEIQRAGGRRG
ncbi:hypothetical protein IF1G_04561 [Cordyceps javanica]|uniref:Uncharacterized protein n=1 Tax=Cordyceps javanica TaxID=43265 RepID=A0A545W3J2_9HYPO|nr:hypothetical protein IF1G_04561 [Cordyceps javanica]TQW08561.1 transmembrane alpha-helix domain-containing protein [Cordyceps javanica]